MELTREQAVKYHRQMWSDMQKALGDNPPGFSRGMFKRNWCEEHFPGEHIECHCFLCEYDNQLLGDCGHCPIAWTNGDCCRSFGGEGVDYRYSPISEILALPEREDV